jgi:hypothetical protein
MKLSVIRDNYIDGVIGKQLFPKVTAEECRHGRHRQPHRSEVFDRHEYAKKPRESYVLMRTKGVGSGRRADVTGFGVRTGMKFPTYEYVR